MSGVSSARTTPVRSESSAMSRSVTLWAPSQTCRWSTMIVDESEFTNDQIA